MPIDYSQTPNAISFCSSWTILFPPVPKRVKREADFSNHLLYRPASEFQSTAPEGNFTGFANFTSISREI